MRPNTCVFFDTLRHHRTVQRSSKLLFIFLQEWCYRTTVKDMSIWALSGTPKSIATFTSSPFTAPSPPPPPFQHNMMGGELRRAPPPPPPSHATDGRVAEIVHDLEKRGDADIVLDGAPAHTSRRQEPRRALPPATTPPAPQRRPARRVMQLKSNISRTFKNFVSGDSTPDAAPQEPTRVHSSTEDLQQTSTDIDATDAASDSEDVSPRDAAADDQCESDTIDRAIAKQRELQSQREKEKEREKDPEAPPSTSYTSACEEDSSEAVRSSGPQGCSRSSSEQESEKTIPSTKPPSTPAYSPGGREEICTELDNTSSPPISPESVAVRVAGVPPPPVAPAFDEAIFNTVVSPLKREHTETDRQHKKEEEEEKEKQEEEEEHTPAQTPSEPASPSRYAHTGPTHTPQVEVEVEAEKFLKVIPAESPCGRCNASEHVVTCKMCYEKEVGGLQEDARAEWLNRARLDSKYMHLREQCQKLTHKLTTGEYEVDELEQDLADANIVISRQHKRIAEVMSELDERQEQHFHTIEEFAEAKHLLKQQQSRIDALFHDWNEEKRKRQSAEGWLHQLRDECVRLKDSMEERDSLQRDYEEERCMRRLLQDKYNSLWERSSVIESSERDVRRQLERKHGETEAMRRAWYQLNNDLAKSRESVATLQRYNDHIRNKLIDEEAKSGGNVQAAIQSLQTKTVAELTDTEVASVCENLSLITPHTVSVIFANTANPLQDIKKLMATLHPDKTPIQACKEGLQKRFQILNHLRSVVQQNAEAGVSRTGSI